MAKVHDKFVIELAEVIKGYGNDPDVDDPFRLSEFYRFYELPEIAVSANHFKTMIPLEVVEKNAQPGWIPVTEKPIEGGQYIVTLKDDKEVWTDIAEWNPTFGGRWQAEFFDCEYHDIDNVVAWQPLPTPYREGGQDGKN